MYKYEWDPETGGFLLTTGQMPFSREPRPVYYKELDVLGFDQFWDYPKDDSAPLMWAEMNNYIYHGKNIARVSGGSLYKKPEVVFLEKPELFGSFLQFVDVDAMCQKNADMMETILQRTAQRIFDVYNKKKHEYAFYVAFSGGKDSVVAFDLVQRSISHDNFSVFFGNTGMEFPTTLSLINEMKAFCESFPEKQKIRFYEASAPFSSEKSWHIFGPPARRKRWCCTVHKTAPVINTFCNEMDLDRLNTVMITGVRRAESSSRSNYEEISFGKKISNQYSFHPVLDWDSSEVYLYIYSNNLMLNEAYKLGFGRVGCIMCPNSSNRHEFIKHYWFPNTVEKFCNIITETSKKDLSGPNRNLFLETGGWKSRLTGRELVFSEKERVESEENAGTHCFTVLNLRNDWKEWYKAIGEIGDNYPYYILEYNKVWRKCVLQIEGNISRFEFQNEKASNNSIEFYSLFKSILVKSQYCIRCSACEAECAERCISMKHGLHISDKCTKCHACLKIESGCLYYDSIKESKDMQSLTGINRYLSVGVDANWINQYYMDPSFEPGNRKTDVMFDFMGDAGLIIKRNLTSFGELVGKLGLSNITPWALMLCNLVYVTPFEWYVENIPFDVPYEEDRLHLDMQATTRKARGEFWNGFKVILMGQP